MNTTRIVLVETSHPGNIGAAARAMKNMGLNDLALVRPKHFPHAEATARASGADDVLARASVYEDLTDAIAQCPMVYAASARQRSIRWPEASPSEAARNIVSLKDERPCAVVFGPETSGLDNADIALAQSFLCIPSVPEFGSLNLAMAVQVVAYELRLAGIVSEPAAAPPEALASQKDLESYYAHLETCLRESGFLNPASPRHLMQRLRRLYARALPSQNEINILRGMLAALWSDKRR